VLPRELLTFRAACGQDIVDDEHPSAQTTDCKWCLWVDRTWLVVKATEVLSRLSGDGGRSCMVRGADAMDTE
jgi:hypothetical protein